MPEWLYWVGFSVFPGIGPKRFQILLQKFGTAQDAWDASENDIAKSIGKAFANKFVTFRSSFDLQGYEKKLQTAKVTPLLLSDENYPRLLKAIENPPFVLFTKGDLDIFSSSDPPAGGESRSPSTGSGQNNFRTRNLIAVVGTRKITTYGREVTEKITQDLVAAGYVIVSGLAFGVDAVAHSTTIENNGKTIAVLGCGVDCCSPRENTALYNRILDSSGAIVSEYPLSALPTKGSFPSRNRIIAGLSQAVVVTEGAEDSGALYTAEDAFKLGRPVFAVPGPVTSQLSKGPHGLINKGAKLVGGGEDILRELQVISPKLQVKKHSKGETDEEQRVIDALENESLHFDELVRKTGMDSVKLGVLLSMMEMKGIVKNVQTGYYALT